MDNHSNIFAELPLAAPAQESVAEIVTTPNLRIERIVSTGQATPADHLYPRAGVPRLNGLSSSACSLSLDAGFPVALQAFATSLDSRNTRPENWKYRIIALAEVQFADLLPGKNHRGPTFQNAVCG